MATRFCISYDVNSAGNLITVAFVKYEINRTGNKFCCRIQLTTVLILFAVFKAIVEC